MPGEILDFDQRCHCGVLFQRCIKAPRPPAAVKRNDRRARGVAAFVGERTARREAAPGRQFRHFRHHASDRGEFVDWLIEPRNRAEQADGIGMLGLLEQGRGGRALHDLSGIHHRHLVANFADHAEVVGNEDDRRAGLGPQLAHQIEDLRLDGHVERGRRLVGDEQLRIARERDGDHRALPHAARQIVRVFVEAFFGGRDFDARKKLDGLVPRLIAATVRGGG